MQGVFTRNDFLQKIIFWQNGMHTSFESYEYKLSLHMLS